MKKKKQSKSNTKSNKSKNNDNYQKNAIQVIEQKESYNNNSSKIEDILNHPILKRRLPPIEKRQNIETNEEEEKIETKTDEDNIFNLEEAINNNIENLNYLKNEKEESIKDSIEIDNLIEKNKKIEEMPEKKSLNNIEKKINIIIEKKTKNEIGAGTPHYYDNIQELKNEVDNKAKIISKLSDEQNNYKSKLNELFQKLNNLLAENAELLYSEETEEESKKEENLNELKIQLELRKKEINSSKNQNKIYKQQYDLLTNKEKYLKNENIEKKIDKIKLENNELIKQIKTLKSQSRKDGKKLEDYTYNGKYISDINKISNELKILENKKHEYFQKLLDNNKFINNCVKEFENLEKFYGFQKNTKNYFNAKVEEEINRLKEDLSGNEEEIIKRIETDNAFIIKKMIHNEKIRENILKTPIINKPADARKMKLKKGNSLEPLAKIKIARNNIHSGQSRRMNIIAKNKSPLLTNINNFNNKEQDDFDPSKINYNDLTDYEYKEMINKKDHCYDVVTKLEKSIKEAQKMYQRKIKEIKTTVNETSEKLNTKNKENELLKSEIEYLNKILSLTEQGNKINIGQITKTKKNNKNMNKGNNIKNNEKELESQKEYLSPEYYLNNNNNNKSDKDKILIPTFSNTDMTRNEILNDLKVLNGKNLDEGNPDSIFVQKNSGKINNFALKFPDLSNIEENINVNINPKNEFERNKIIDDIKKKYNIKNDYDDNDLNDDLNLDYENDDDEERILKKQERLKKEEIEERQRIEKEIEDENKFFKIHENILKNEEEGQFEPPIQDNIINYTINNNKYEENKQGDIDLNNNHEIKDLKKEKEENNNNNNENNINIEVNKEENKDIINNNDDNLEQSREKKEKDKDEIQDKKEGIKENEENEKNENNEKEENTNEEINDENVENKKQKEENIKIELKNKNEEKNNKEEKEKELEKDIIDNEQHENPQELSNENENNKNYENNNNNENDF